jgi:hypothetical protein
MPATVELAAFIQDFAWALEVADSKRPCHPPYQPGIGPHTEDETVALVMAELASAKPTQYQGVYTTAVPYPGGGRQKCDLCFGQPPSWSWSVEVKMLRMLGDNGKPNDNMITHILSPYDQHRSALTDCWKLGSAGFSGRKAVLIYAYDYDAWPAADVITPFEQLAQRRVTLGDRHTADFSGLMHPVHRRGFVYGWELIPQVRRTRIKSP